MCWVSYLGYLISPPILWGEFSCYSYYPVKKTKFKGYVTGSSDLVAEAQVKAQAPNHGALLTSYFLSRPFHPSRLQAGEKCIIFYAMIVIYMLV